MDNRNCLSYWFPKLQESGVPVPRTEIVRCGPDTDLSLFLDGKEPTGWKEFLKKISFACQEIGYPCFLRTGQGSGKHQWKDTCYVESANNLIQHIGNLVEWSHIVDFMGLDHDVWVVRELLPTEPIAILPAYGDFPLVREVRGFIRNGNIICIHPYWPEKAVREGFGMRYEEEYDSFGNDEKEEDFKPGWKNGRHPIPGDLDEIIRAASIIPSPIAPWEQLLKRVAGAFAGDGAWSVDVLETTNGLYVTDMAEAHRSFHWEGCEAKDQLTNKST